MYGKMCHGNNNRPKIHPKGMATLKKHIFIVMFKLYYPDKIVLGEILKKDS